MARALRRTSYIIGRMFRESGAAANAFGARLAGTSAGADAPCTWTFAQMQ